MRVEEQKIDGIILLRGVENDSVLKYLTDRHFPTGLTGSCKYEEILQVDADHYQAAASLMSVLIGQGYRKFAFVAGDMQYRVNQNRSEGCYAALKQYGPTPIHRHSFMQMMSFVPVSCPVYRRRVIGFLMILESYHCVTVPVWSALLRQ